MDQLAILVVQDLLEPAVLLVLPDYLGQLDCREQLVSPEQLVQLGQPVVLEQRVCLDPRVPQALLVYLVTQDLPGKLGQQDRLGQRELLGRLAG